MAKEIVDLCDKYNRFAFIAYCLRFAPPYKKIKTLVDSGELGKVFSIRASVAGKKAITDAHTNYRTVKKLGGGVISDFSHEIDYSLWFAGKPVKMVKINWFKSGSQGLGCPRHS
ncbi:MAG: Gfo/Idh/MocA family protein [Flexilinea sp.]